MHLHLATMKSHLIHHKPSVSQDQPANESAPFPAHFGVKEQLPYGNCNVDPCLSALTRQSLSLSHWLCWHTGYHLGRCLLSAQHMRARQTCSERTQSHPPARDHDVANTPADNSRLSVPAAQTERLKKVYSRVDLIKFKYAALCYNIDRSVRKKLFLFKIWNPVNIYRSHRLHPTENHSRPTQRRKAAAPRTLSNVAPPHVVLPSLYLVNASSLAKPHAIEQLETDVKGYDSEIVMVTETHLKQKHSEATFAFENYRTIRRDRAKRRGGGVAMFVKKSLSFTVLEKSDHFEIIWVCIESSPKSVIIGLLYHPPRHNYPELSLLKYLENKVTAFNERHPDSVILIAGDFNQLSESQLVEHTALYNIVHRPTRGSSYLDRIYLSEGHFSHVKVTTPCIKSDHLAVVAYNGPTKTAINKKRFPVNYRPRKPGQIAAYKEELSRLCFSFTDDQNTQQSFDIFYKVLSTTIDNNFPERSITISSNDPSFVTPYIKSLLRKKNRLLHKGNYPRAEAISLQIRSLIVQHNASKLTGLSLKHDSKSLWQAVREISHPKIIPKSDSEPDCPITAEILNNHYANTSKDNQYVQFAHKHAVRDDAPTFQEHDVHSALSKLRKTAMGHDNIPYWALKIGADFLSAPITQLLNKSVQESCVPTQWKTAVISPVPKIQTPQSPADYRPISLTSILSRVAERLVITKHIYPFILGNEDFNSQFAFRPTGSTTAAIVAITSSITKILDNQRFARMLCLDFSKAFDTVRHSSVIEQFGNLDIPDSIYNWLCSFFTGRSHLTKFQGLTSGIQNINCSVVQGSAIGPVAFAAVTTTLKSIHSDNTIITYADDTYIIIPEDSISTTTDELNNIKTWAQNHNLRFNEKKSVEIVFSRPQLKTSNLPPPIASIPRVTQVKILGVTFSDKLKVNAHVEDSINKCSSLLYALKILRSQGMGTSTIHSLFQSLVTSRLLYASPAWWGYASAHNKNRIKSFLHRSSNFGYRPQTAPTLEQLVDKIHRNLYDQITTNADHILFNYLPPRQNHQHNLRQRRHPFLVSSLTENNRRCFLNRMLFNII